VLTGLRLEVSASGVEAAGRAVLSGNSIDVGDLPMGRSAWVMGRVPRGSARDLGFRLLTADNREVATRRGEVGDVRPALKALFGARRVLGLEFLIGSGQSGEELREQLKHLGYEAGDLSVDRKVYAENARREAGEALKKLLVREALRYGLASSETAFVAVRTEAGRPVEGTVAVANALPSGWVEVEMGAFTGARRAMRVAAFGFGKSLSSMPAPASPPPSAMMLDVGDSLSSMPAPASPPPSAMMLDVGDSLSSMPAPASPPSPSAQLNALMQKSIRVSSPGLLGPSDTGRVVFDGQPTVSRGEAVLFDSTATGAATLPEATRFTRLRVEFAGAAPAADTLDPGLWLSLFVGDLAVPVARMRLADLVRLGGERPLNVTRSAGAPVRLVLSDPVGAWTSGAPAMKVTLVCE
jgi:Ca-activated chloride channel family protein